MSDDLGVTSNSVVWVFGGGITGLSVAHECIERGYEVYLVEPAEDSWDDDKPAVGGLARTQWAYIPNGAPPQPPDITRALPFVRHPSFEFSGSEIESVKKALAPTGEPMKEEAAAAAALFQEVSTTLKRFARRAREATRGAGYRELTVVLLAPMAKAAKPATDGDAPQPSGAVEQELDALTKAAVAVRSALSVMLAKAIADDWNEMARFAPAEGEKPKAPGVADEEDILWVDDLDNFRIEVRVDGRGVVPGEHGFRYFPGFYRHLFDTMQRTPVLQPGEDRFGRTVKTVFDNLVSTEATWLVVDAEAAAHAKRDAEETKGAKKEREGREAVEAAEEEAAGRPARRGRGEKLVSFPRRPPQSIQQTLTILESFVRELGYSGQDVSRLTTKLFQYMTTSTARRAAEFEDLTWWDFIEGERFTEACRRHMELGPEVLGAMTASESETRTQGNCVTQLLIDQLLGRKLTDATLNGPTSVAWFDPWRDYLTYRGVKFLRGQLVGFKPPPEGSNLHDKDVLLPTVVPGGGLSRDGRTIDFMALHNFDTGLRKHYFVMAVPVTSMLDLPEFNLVRADHSPWPSVPGKERVISADAGDGFGLAAKFHAAMVARGLDPATAPDIVALLDWQKGLAAEKTPRDVGLGPLRHLTGVQYLFDNNVQFGQEHTLYMDSPWRLSSISQAHFWRRRPTGVYGYRGIVSVDIGALHRDAPVPVREGGDDALANAMRKGWNCTCDDIAVAVWRQVAPSIAADTQSARLVGRELLDMAPGPLGPSLAYQGPLDRSGAADRGGRRATVDRDDYDEGPRRDARAGAAKNISRMLSIQVPTVAGNLTPSCYHLDEGIIFSRDASKPGVAKNLSPYLINRPGEWKKRPGRVDPEQRKRGYEMQNKSWVLAGTYMKTFTRLTTMEAANESARHAVNAILRDSAVAGDRCMIWDPEEMELPDFADLREIDRKLFADGYPHLVEILGVDEIPEALLPRQLDLKGPDHA